MQHTAVHCSILQHTAATATSSRYADHTYKTPETLQHTATHCDKLQDAERRCNTLQHTATLCNNRGLRGPKLSGIDEINTQKFRRLVFLDGKVDFHIFSINFGLINQKKKMYGKIVEH